MADHHTGPTPSELGVMARDGAAGIEEQLSLVPEVDPAARTYLTSAAHLLRLAAERLHDVEVLEEPSP